MTIDALPGLAARFVHLTASLLVVGAGGVLLLAGPSDRPTAQRWHARVARLARGAVVLALLAAVGTLAHQTAVLEARGAAALEVPALLRVLLQTRGGAVWLVRGALLVLLAVFLLVRLDVRRRVDWAASRGEIVLLGGAALALVAASSHAAAVEPDAAAAIAWDVAHLLAAGLWIGGLLPLALLLWACSRDAGGDTRPYAVLTARRFSRLALWLVLGLAVSGAWNALAQLGSMAALLGTRHGHLLLVKLAIFLALVLTASLSRRLVPALSGPAEGVGRPAMRKLAAWVVVESALALGVLAIVAAMSVTAPGRHEPPVWPLSFRLTLEGLAETPAVRTQVLVGSQVAVLGAVGVLATLFLRRMRLPVLAGAVVVVAGGLGIALPPLASDAYPTTYQRPPVAYQAASISDGARRFAEHCAVCHGARGAGDGPAAASLQPRPPDLRAHHATLHTAGDLYWWITHGKGQMPAFADRLPAEDRWHLINHLRALAAGLQAQLLGTELAGATGPWIAAPDFAFAVGPTPSRTLREYRGRRVVLLVLYALPDSRARLAALAQAYERLAPLGVEIVAVPRDADPDAIKRLGDTPRVLFPVVTEGAREIVDTYALFDRAAHAEFLVDRQGYLRARWSGAAGGADAQALLTLVDRLNAEKAVAPPPAEHVH